jgi:glycosyltransferase involved in cell wall biosynthesis
MRICLLGDYSGNLDEGMRKVSFHFAGELSKRHKILTSDLRKVFTKNFRNVIKNFNPEIIHYIHGPSAKSFTLLKLISFYCRDAKTVMSAMHPGFSFLSKRFIPMFKPDVILVQSIETEEKFKKLGCETEFLPCGVDVKNFVPFSNHIKEELREKYGIDKDKFVILHVGSIKEGRSIEIFKEIARTKEDQVIIIGNRSMGIEPHLYQGIKESGCKVWVQYFKNIEGIYALSDCYVFPTPPMNRINSIETPLSVLEAMSCNLPVVTTKFGALPRVFEGEDGLFFVENKENIFTALDEIKNGIVIKTREKVLPYSWENVVRRLEELYEKLLSEEE